MERTGGNDCEENDGNNLKKEYTPLEKSKKVKMLWANPTAFLRSLKIKPL